MWLFVLLQSVQSLLLDLVLAICTTLPFAFGGGVYSAGDVLNYAFLASRLQSASLQTKLHRHSSIVISGPSFDDALCAFNAKMEIDLLINPCEIDAPNSFVSGRAVIEAAQRKRVKYEAKCANIGYGLLLISLVKRIRKFLRRMQ